MGLRGGVFGGLMHERAGIPYSMLLFFCFNRGAMFMFFLICFCFPAWLCGFCGFTMLCLSIYLSIYLI